MTAGGDEERLPETIPVFPLPGVLLLPGGRLPLNIFEPRYVAMVEDALGSPQRAIGMIQPLDPAAADAAPPLYPIGCLGRITSFAEHEGGRYRFLITLTGVSRFTVVEEVDGARGYRRMRVDWSPWRRDMLAAGQPPEPMADRQRLLATIKRYFATNEISADWRAITETPDDRLITTLAMVCPFSPNEKQGLLEAPGPAERARTLVALMEMGSLQAGDGGDRPRH